MWLIGVLIEFGCLNCVWNVGEVVGVCWTKLCNFGCVAVILNIVFSFSN